MDINQNIAQCLQNTNNLGSTVIHNICNGTSQVVPWGGLDWIILFGISGVVLAFTVFFGAMVWDGISMSRRFR